MIVVSDTSPLIGLQQIQRLELLHRLFDAVLVPPAVRDELIGSPTFPSGLPNWIQVEQATDRVLIARARPVLDRGEAEAIALAVEHQLPLIIDERKGRREAQALGLQVVGVAGVLVAAKRRGELGAVGPDLVALQKAGFRLGDSVIREALRLAGETFQT